MATVKQVNVQAIPLEELEGMLVDRLNTGRAALPLLPAVASEAIRLANDPSADVNLLARLVEKDPPIAARMLSFANSAIYSRGVKTTSARAAIVRLGLAGARDLLFQVVYANSSAGLRRYQQQVGESFARALLTAVGTRAICLGLNLRYDFDYLCGLLHDIGEGRVYRILADLPEPVEGIAGAEMLVARYHARAGAQLAEVWKLPQEIIESCERHHEASAAGFESVRLVMAADLIALTVPRGAACAFNEDELARLTELLIPEAVAVSVQQTMIASVAQLPG